MSKQLKKRQAGQGMVEYIIIVAVVALGSIAVYTAFGDVLRGQVAEAASTLTGESNGKGRESAEDAADRATNSGNMNRTLKDYSD